MNLSVLKGLVRTLKSINWNKAMDYVSKGTKAIEVIVKAIKLFSGWF